MGTFESVKLLLEKDADKSLKDNSGKTACAYTKEAIALASVKEKKEKLNTILELVCEKKKVVPWEGVSKSDIEKFDIFFETPYDYAVCPVCLSFIERKDGCMFMGHQCAKDSDYFNEELMTKYDTRGTGLIEWCTVCGRPTVTQGGHKHYELVSYSDARPKTAKFSEEVQARMARENQAYFDNSACKGLGGGGLEEKVARFRRLREYALELNEKIGKISHEEAMKELIEEVFNAPLFRSKKPAQIIEKKEWNIKASEFPNIKREEKKEENNSKNYPNIPFIGMRPTEKKAGDCMCVIGGEDDIVTYSFNHKDREGGVDHADMCICEEDLTTAIKQINANFGDVERPIGYCWFHKCKAILYPEELKGIVPNDVYEEYRKKFNKQMALKKGGSRNRTRKLKKYQKGGNKHSNRSILHPVDVNKITCWSPPNKKK